LVTSGAAGTRRYMAPEWTQIVDRASLKALQFESGKTFESLMKLDIYALGIILSDLLCNPTTLMETVRIDKCLKTILPTLP
jgi:serine/threonine protein kinase